MRYHRIVKRQVYRYAVTTRLAHWVWVLAFFALVSSGLQIFNAAPYLDASDTSNPARRVLSIDSPADGVGTTAIFGHTFTTTGWLGWTSDGMGGKEARAFPSWITIPAYQSLADGRRWHFFFAWVAAICWLAWLISSAIKGNLRDMVLRKNDIYNPRQQAAYAAIAFVVAPLIVLTGLALSPGIDAIAQPLTWIFGGRQFARTWHFVLMLLLCGFFVVHVLQVATHGIANQLRSMITGWYSVDAREGEQP